jgi:hypothetical protein
MEAARPPAGRIRVGDVIGETFSIYGQNVGSLIGSALLVFVVVGLISGILQSIGGIILVLVAAVVRLMGYALYTGFVVKLVQDVRDGRRDETMGELFSSAAPAIFPLIGFGILFGIGVAFGLVLLVVPGLILLTFWSVGAAAIVAERAGVFEAFGRSWSLVRGDAWPVFGTLVVVLLIVIAIGFVLGAIATPIGDAAILIAAVISNAVTAPVFALATAVMFFDPGGGEATEVAPTTQASPPPPPAAPTA